MKGSLMLKVMLLVAISVPGIACTLSTTGLRAPTDHSLATRATSEVYDKVPEASQSKPATAH